MNPRSPAKPQHCTASTVTTAAQQRPAIATSLSTLPILRTLQTGWTATGPRSGAIVEARQHGVVDELDAVLNRQRSRRASSSSGRCRGWCRRRSASGRPRSPRAARGRARPTSGRRAVDQPLALERLPAAQAVERGRIARRRSRRAGTAARPRSAAPRRRSRAADPCCARRSSGSRPGARRRCRRGGGTKCTGRASAGDHFGNRPPETLRRASRRALHRSTCRRVPCSRSAAPRPNERPW